MPIAVRGDGLTDDASAQVQALATMLDETASDEERTDAHWRLGRSVQAVGLCVDLDTVTSRRMQRYTREVIPHAEQAIADRIAKTAREFAIERTGTR